MENRERREDLENPLRAETPVSGGEPAFGTGEPVGPPPFQEGLFTSFPCDLNREEYIRFNLVVSRLSGVLRFQTVQAVLFGLMGAFTLSVFFIDLIAYQTVDPMTLLLLVFLAAVGAALFIALPRHLRRSAGLSYDQSLRSGHSYYGWIDVYADRLCKRNESRTTVLRFADGALYIETPEMMILLAPGAPAIVIPARCLTPRDADSVRRAVIPGVPAMRQRSFGRLVPKAEEPIRPPEEAPIPDDEERLRMQVAYTKEEFVSIACASSLRGFLKLLPAYSGLTVFSALLFGLTDGFGMGIAVFVGMNAVLFALHLLPARSRAVRAYEAMPEGVQRVGIALSDRGITVRSFQPGEPLRLVWESVDRAVERADSVEFFAGSTFLRIPKRCIEDMATLREFVDAHMTRLPAKNHRH